MGKKLAWVSIVAFMVLTAGCGNQTAKSSLNVKTGSATVSSPSSSPSTAIQPSANGSPSSSTPQHHLCYQCKPYQGTKNLAHWVSLAKANPKNAQDQFKAGLAENVNKNPNAALTYFKAAVKLDPKMGIAFNDIGNMYYRSLNDPKQAVPYYQKATEVQPSYDYGWLNWMLAEQALGNSAKAKAIASQAIKVLPPKDQLYALLKKGAQ